MVVSRRWAKVCSLEVGWCRCSLVQFISVSVEPTRGACQQMVDQSTMVMDCRREVRLTAREREVLSNPGVGLGNQAHRRGVGRELLHGREPHRGTCG